MFSIKSVSIDLFVNGSLFSLDDKKEVVHPGQKRPRHLNSFNTAQRKRQWLSDQKNTIVP